MLRRLRDGSTRLHKLHRDDHRGFVDLFFLSLAEDSRCQAPRTWLRPDGGEQQPRRFQVLPDDEL